MASAKSWISLCNQLSSARSPGFPHLTAREGLGHRDCLLSCQSQGHLTHAHVQVLPEREGAQLQAGAGRSHRAAHVRPGPAGERGDVGIGAIEPREWLPPALTLVCKSCQAVRLLKCMLGSEDSDSAVHLGSSAPREGFGRVEKCVGREVCGSRSVWVEKCVGR